MAAFADHSLSQAMRLTNAMSLHGVISVHWNILAPSENHMDFAEDFAPRQCACHYFEDVDLSDRRYRSTERRGTACWLPNAKALCKRPSVAGCDGVTFTLGITAYLPEAGLAYG
jgi:hypothetical protein